MSDDGKVRAFSRPDCPWAVLAGAKGKRAVLVRDFMRFAQSQSSEPPQEDEVDRFVDAVGGSRLGNIDLYSAIGRFFRRTPKAPRGHSDVYELPSKFFSSGDLTA